MIFACLLIFDYIAAHQRLRKSNHPYHQEKHSASTGILHNTGFQSEIMDNVVLFFFFYFILFIYYTFLFIFCQFSPQFSHIQCHLLARSPSITQHYRARRTKASICFSPRHDERPLMSLDSSTRLEENTNCQFCYIS